MKRAYGRYSIETSNEDKPLFPGNGLTKGDLIDYYERIADVMLPHVRDRPLVMRRCPDGIEAPCFYQKQIGKHFPSWIERITVSTRDGDRQTLAVANNKATLVYLANQAVVPMHVWLSRRDLVNRPDRLVIDLDPPSERFEPVRRAARNCRDLLEELGARPFLQTTGSRGLHVVVALDRDEDFDAVRELARSAMDLLASRYPDALTTEVRKNKRKGRVYLDVARNAYGQTAVAPYSIRALPGAPVATPVDWDELGDRRLDARRWHVGNVFRRLGQRSDPWNRISRSKTSLEALRRRLEGVVE